MERTAYMQRIMTATYHQVPVEAILHGFNQSWDRVIAKRLKEDYDKGVAEAEVIIEYIGGSSPTHFLKAASLILNSTPSNHD